MSTGNNYLDQNLNFELDQSSNHAELNLWGSKVSIYLSLPKRGLQIILSSSCAIHVLHILFQYHQEMPYWLNIGKKGNSKHILQLVS